MPPRHSLAGSAQLVRIAEKLAVDGVGSARSVVEKQDQLDAQLQQFLRAFVRRQRESAQQQTVEIRELLEHIHRHPFDPELNVQRLKQDLRIHDNNVSTRFRRALGIGLREYIEALRMAAARHLLDHVESEIYLIATAVGYNHQETFTRAFRRHVGCAPSDYSPDSQQPGAAPENGAASLADGRKASWAGRGAQ